MKKFADFKFKFWILFSARMTLKGNAQSEPIPPRKKSSWYGLGLDDPSEVSAVVFALSELCRSSYSLFSL